MAARYARERLKQLLRELASRLSRPPTAEDVVREPSFPCYATFLRHFGTFEGARRAAGLAPLVRKRRWTVDLIDDAIRRAHAELGRPPRRTDFIRLDYLPGPDTLAKYVGSVKDALARVGLRPGKRPHPHDAIPDSALIARLKEVARELGHTPTLREIGVAGPYSAKLYVARFGGWNRALAKARLAPRRRRRAASKDEIRRYLDAFVARGGHPPSVEDLRSDPWAPRMSAIAKRFGGLREAIEDAGLGADHLPPSWDDFDDAALVAALQELARRIGRAPDSKLAEWLDGFPGPRVYAERFGSWFDALRAAELDSVHKRFRARDGHVCESAAERLVDDFLTGNGIQHEIHVRYAAHPVLNPDRRYVADWQLDDGTLVEYFGVVNRPDYDRRRAHKEALADALGIRLVSITPRALGPGKLEALLADYL